MKDNEIKVSVLCTAYNHEKFLRKCLDGFVMQKTNFKFEVIVHDDASTDGTKLIIEEYVKKYPDIIIPIYQTENQYSKGIGIMDNILFPKSKGKYIALCEGDDFWCDENKLQLQYDFMEEHPECSACFHNSVKRDLFGKFKDQYFNNWKTVHYLTPKETICEYYVHTSSFFIRREIFVKKNYQKGYIFGDYVRLTGFLLEGKLAVLPKIMSVYNFNNTGGLTYKVHTKMNLLNWAKEERMICKYLNEYNHFSNYVYDEYVLNKMLEIDFDVFNRLIEFDIEKETINLNIKKLLSRVKNHPYYPIYVKKNKGIKKIKTFIKFHSPYIVYKIWMKLKNKKKKTNGK